MSAIKKTYCQGINVLKYADPLVNSGKIGQPPIVALTVILKDHVFFRRPPERELWQVRAPRQEPRGLQPK